MLDNLGPRIPFVKMQGSGNDFVVIDNRKWRVPVAAMADWAKAVCRRAFGVGADGLFFLENPPADRPGVDFIWHFYNADGSRAEMCGNGSRCAARLAHLLGMAPARHVIGTDAGPVHAQVLEDGRVKVLLTPAKDARLNIALPAADKTYRAHFVNTGVPHTVLFVDDASKVDLANLGRAIRFHETFAPKGTNVNFAQVLGERSMLLRTYERGVEAETFACGTGASAAVYLSHKLGLTGPEVNVTTSGGEQLTITVEGADVFLAGAAVATFTGELLLESIGLSL